MIWLVLGVIAVLAAAAYFMSPAVRRRRTSHDLASYEAHRKALDQARVGYLGEAPPTTHHRLGPGPRRG